MHISKYYYPFRGGTEQIARDCVNVLDRTNEQLVICFNDEAKSKEDQVDKVRIIRAGCAAKIASQGISLSYGRKLWEAIRTFKPEIIIFHYPNPFVAHYLLKYIPSDVRLILYWHLDIIKQKLLGKLFIGQNNRLLKRADSVIATSPNYVEGSPWLSRYRDKVDIVFNCIDAKRLVCSDETERRAREIKEENCGKIICFAVGRHTEYKGYKYLIQAAHLLDERFFVLIGGKGEETRELYREAGDDSKIRFLGFLEDDELKAYMKAMDIFCFPSITKNEAFGVALAEGMYFGKPAVTFTIPGSGVNYVNIAGETGLEVPNRDVKAYAGALTKLGDNEQLRKRLGDNARARVEKLFMYESFADSITALINKEKSAG